MNTKIQSQELNKWRNDIFNFGKRTAIQLIYSSTLQQINQYGYELGLYLYEVIRQQGQCKKTISGFADKQQFLRRCMLQKVAIGSQEGFKDLLFGTPFINKMRFQQYDFQGVENQLERKLYGNVLQRDQIDIEAQQKDDVQEIERQDYTMVQIAQQPANQLLNSPLASQLSYYFAKLMPFDVKTGFLRNQRGFDYSAFLNLALRNLDYNPEMLIDSFDLRQEQNYDQMQIKNIFSLDEQLSKLLISPNTFFIVYALCTILSGDVLDEDNMFDYNITEQELMQRVVYLAIIGCIQFMNRVRQNNYEIFRPVDLILQGVMEVDNPALDMNLNRILNRTIENIIADPDNKQLFEPVIQNASVRGPAYFTQIVFEASNIFDVYPQGNIVNQAALDVDANLKTDITDALQFAIQGDMLTAQNSYISASTYISKQFKQMFGYIYLTFIEGIKRFNAARQNQGNLAQKIARIDMFFELIQSSPIREFDWRLQGSEGRINYIQINNNRKFSTYRFTITEIPDASGRVSPVRDIVDRAGEIYMGVFIGWMMNYGDEDQARNFLAQFQLDPRVDFSVERISMKPLIWFEKQQSEVQRVQSSLAFQQFLTQNQVMQNAEQMGRLNEINEDVRWSTSIFADQNKINLYGFLSYKEFAVDRIFINEEYDEQRFLLHQLIQNATCIQCVMAFIILKYYKEIFEQFLDIITTKTIKDANHLQLNEFFNELILKQQPDGDLIIKLINIFELDDKVQVVNQFQLANKNKEKDCIFIYDNHVFVANNEKLDQFELFLEHQNKSLEEIQITLRGKKGIKLNQFKQRNQKQFRMFEVNKEDRFNIKRKEDEFQTFNALQIFKSQNLYARIYFDFETTYLDDDKFLQTKLINKENAFDQVSFCVSFLREISFNINAYIQKIRRISHFFDQLFQFTYFEDISILDQQAHVIWSLNSEQQLIRLIEEIEFKIQQQAQQFNEILINASQQLKEKMSIKNLNKLLINCNVICMSYNGAKFDNHFIIRGYKMLYPLDWSQKLNVTGSFSDIKILQVGHILYHDLLLMTGAGCKLSKLAEAMQININKLDLKIEEVAPTFKLAQQNKEEIMKYCARDTELLIQIFNKFKVTIAEIIVQYIYNEIGENEEQKQLIEDFKEIAADNLQYKLSEIDIILDQLGNWSTISSLSLKIYKNYFCEAFTAGVTDPISYKNFKNSYFGGFTQAFWIGENRDDERVRYLDFNSMYPYIMASLKLPTDFSYSNYRSMQLDSAFITSLKEYYELASSSPSTLELFAADPLQRDENGYFSINQAFGDYNLFTIKAFEFKDDVFSPQIPVRTKNYGTIYPLQFDVREVQDLQDQIKDGIPVFGYKLRKLFSQNQLKYVIVTGITFVANRKIESVFSKFDNFLYSKRCAIKKQNPVMAQCIKILLNSLYGKFGQSVFPITFLINENEYNDQDIFRQRILYAMKQDKTIDQTKVQYNKMDQQSLQQLQVKVDAVKETLFNIQNHYLVELTNAPQLTNGSGSLVYWASLITDVGRTLINDVILYSLGEQKKNLYEKTDARVYYCDTDSVILNEIAYNNLLKSNKVLIDDVILGGLKDEYPNDILKEIRIVNKKVYQYKIKGKWINKFKGVKNPDESFYQRLKNTGSFKTKQTKFSKKMGAVSIIKDLDMLIYQRLARKINVEDRSKKQYSELDSCQGNYTLPYQTVQEFYKAYNNKKGIKYSWERFNWEIF